MKWFTRKFKTPMFTVRDAAARRKDRAQRLEQVLVEMIQEREDVTGSAIDTSTTLLDVARVYHDAENFIERAQKRIYAEHQQGIGS